MTRRPSISATILAATVLVLAALPAAYVGGYFWLGVRHDWTPGKLVRVERTYPQKRLADIDKPAAIAEMRLRGVEVVITRLSKVPQD